MGVRVGVNRGEKRVKKEREGNGERERGPNSYVQLIP
jgi:hypothetical protein